MSKLDPNFMKVISQVEENLDWARSWLWPTLIAVAEKETVWERAEKLLLNSYNLSSYLETLDGLNQNKWYHFLPIVLKYKV